MTPPPDPRRLDDLLVRHWAGDLSSAEADELDRALASDPAAADLFEWHLAVAVAAAEGAAPAARPDRRRWLKAGGLTLGGLAAGGLLAARLARPAAAAGAVLVRWTGSVWVHGADGPAPAVVGQRLAAGGGVRTAGPDATAVFAYPDGTTVALAGDTEARLTAADDRRLVVERGAVTAAPQAEPYTVATAEADAAAAPGARLQLSRSAERTDLGVTAGRVRLTGPDGRPLAAVGGGQTATVGGGATRVGPSAAPPDQYAWDLTRPLPACWLQGRLEADPTAGPAGRCVVPELRDDPYLHQPGWAIRSDNRWLRGLFLVHPDSTFRVRYRVDRPGPGQLLVVVRQTPPVPDPALCNVLLAPLPFEPAADGGWRTAVLPASGWRVEPRPDRTPPGPQPWFAFVMAFNTYGADLGLRVAEFAVRRGPP